MLNFYYVNKDYADYLRQTDNKVPELEYDSNDKFFCGIVLSVNGISYYAPISHDTQYQQTSLLIKDKGKSISSIKFAFMIPVSPNQLNRIDFSEVEKTDKKYADLLRAEYRYCASHKTDINEKALKVYAIGCNPSHRLNSVCCNFKKLEEAMVSFQTSNN